MRHRPFGFIQQTVYNLRSSLRLRLSVMVIGLFLLTVLVSTVTTFVLIQRTEAHKWQGRQMDALKSATGTIDAFLQRVEDSARWISLLTRTDLEEKPKLLGDVLRQHPRMVELVRTDVTNRVFISANQGDPLLSSAVGAAEVLSLATHISGAKQKYVQVTAFADNPERFLIYVLRVPSGGVVIARLRMDVLWDVVSQIRFGETGTFFIATRAGTVIAHTDPSMTNRILPESARFFLTGETIVGEYINFQGMPVVASATPVPNTDWIVVAEMAHGEAYAETNQTLVTLPIAVFLIGVVVISVIHQLLQYSLFEPIDLLRQGTERIGQGDLRYRIAVSGHDEIGRVAASFNTMAEHLTRRNQDLVLQTQLLVAQIAEREKAQIALHTSEARYRAVVQDQTELICRFQANGRLTFVNDALVRYFDLPMEKLIGQSFLELLPVAWRESAYARLVNLGPADTWGTWEYAQEVGGVDHWQAWTIRALFDAENNLREYQAVGRDITEQKRIENQLMHEALHDALTGLPNRVLLLERLNRLLEHTAHQPGYGFAVLFLDMDRFKIINDTLGHLIGDQLLIRAAKRLVSLCRSKDLVARLGGDEFAVLIEDIKEKTEVVQIVERLQIGLKEPIRVEGHELYATVSIGIALELESVGHMYSRVEDLLRDADTAMYRAKVGGSGQYMFFEPTMRHQITGVFHLEAELRRALDQQEFTLMYQPIYNSQTLEPTQAEALVRWHHPQRGLLLPSEFIGLAEETGLIRPLGEWILRTACSQARIWLNQNCALQCISINVSPSQFDSDGFVELVCDILEETQLPPRMLQLEITESIAMRDMEQVESRMHALEKLGVQIAIDDFGTGYSSLARLQRFPLTTLKIDRLFIQDLVNNPDDAAITSAIIAMAHNLKLKVIAEGVEHLEQAQFLRLNGCDQVQGFFFSQPVSVEACDHLFKRV